MSEICLKKNKQQLVYVTNFGKKYHLENCIFLRSCIEIDLKTALKKYSPCPKCNPPIKLIDNEKSHDRFIDLMIKCTKRNKVLVK